jgi:1,4-alpha-glucan branching enzyme
MYGGGNMGNAGGVNAEARPMHGFDHSMSLIVPPLGFVLLKK